MTDIDKLITDLSNKAGYVKTMPHPVISLLKWTVGAGIYLTLLILCSSLREDFSSKLDSLLFITEIGLLTCMILTSGLSVAVLSFPDMHQKPWAMYAPFVTLTLLCTVLAVEWLEDVPPSPKPHHSGIDCLICIISYSIIPACWIFYRLRKTASTHSALTGCVAVLGAYSIGSLALRLSEKTDSITHLIEWHYIPMLVFSAIGLWLGKRFLKW